MIEFTNNEKDYSYKILEKEKDLAEEFKARYDVQLIENSKLEKRIKELEIQLHNEIQKKTDYKEELNSLLEKEKNQTSKLEKYIIEMKDALSKSDLSSRNQQSNHELELQKKNQEVESLMFQIKDIKDSLERSKNENKTKYEIIQKQFTDISNKYAENTKSMNNTNNELKRNFNDQISFQTENFISKLKTIEEENNNNKKTTDKLLKENQSLKTQIQNMILDKQIEINEKEKRITEFFENKHNNEIKSYNNKISTLNAINENLNNKINDLSNSIIEIRQKQGEEIKLLNEGEIKTLNEEVLKLKKENVVLHERYNEAFNSNKTIEASMFSLKSQINELNRLLLINKKERENDNLNNSNKYSYNNDKLNKEIDQLKIRNEELQNIVKLYKAKIDGLNMNHVNAFMNLKKRIKDL